MGRRLSSWGAVVAWVALTFVVSHQPVVVIPFGAPDYVAHALNYAVLSALLIWAMSDGSQAAMTPSLMASAVVVATVLGIADEFHQSFVPGRDATVQDVMADAVGAAAAACVVAVIVGLRRQHGRPT